MATIPLVDRYRRYKRGTDRLIEWLASSGRRATPAPKVHTPLHVDDLVILAQSICDNTPPISVPSEILLVTADVIEGRRVCADFYNELVQDPKLNDTSLGKRNKTHRYFISILENVQGLLRATSKLTSTKSAKLKSLETDDRKVEHNLFAYLELEEPAETITPTAAVSQAAAGRPSKRAPKVILDNEEDDLSFALWCFLQDAHEMRKFTQGVWNRYYSGDITFAVATQTTEMAFAMIRDLQNHLTVNTKGKMSFMNDVVDMLQMDMFRGPDGRYFCSFDDVNAPEDASEFFCIPAAIVLGQFCDDKEDHTALMWSADHHFSKALFSVREEIKALSHQGDLNTAVIGGVHMEEFTRGLLPMITHQVVLLSTVVQSQIYMDIFDAIGARQTIGRDYGGAKLRMLKAEVDNYCEADTQDDWAIKNLRRMTGDLELYFAPRPNAVRFKLLSKLPLLAARWSNEIVNASRRVSCSAANFSVILLSVAYLYRAAKCCGALDRNWDDMEFLIADQSVHGAYVRSAETVEGYARHYDLAIGVKASVFARNRSSRPPLPSNKQVSSRMTKIQPTSPVLQAEVDKGVSEKIEAAKNGAWSPGTDPSYAILHIVAGRTAGKKAKSLPPLDLLEALEKALVKAEPAFNFDLLTLFARCKVLIDGMISDFPGQLRHFDRNGPVYTHKHVDKVLWEAATAERLGKPKEDTILFDVGRAIEALINEHGADCLIKASIARSSGHLAEERWPCKQHPKGGMPTQLKDMFRQMQDSVDPNQKRYNEEHTKVIEAAEKERRKWESNGVQKDVMKRKLVGFINAEFKKRGVPRKAEPTNDGLMYDIVRTDKVSEMEDMLSRMQIGEMSTVGEVMQQHPMHLVPGSGPPGLSLKSRPREPPQRAPVFFGPERPPRVPEPGDP